MMQIGAFMSHAVFRNFGEQFQCLIDQIKSLGLAARADWK